jgi:hypothetical protein
VSVRAVLLSTLAVMAVIPATTPVLRAQPSRPLAAGASEDLLKDNVRGATVAVPHLVMGHGIATVHHAGQVASATGPLDLRTLSLADFGDVEPGR